MPTSVVYNGKVLDYHYKKYNDQPYTMYGFYIADMGSKIFIGHIYKSSRRGRTSWDAVCTHPNRTWNVCDGFVSRYAASEFMLKSCGIIKKDAC